MSRPGPKEMQRRALRKGGASLSEAIIEADAHPPTGKEVMPHTTPVRSRNSRHASDKATPPATELSEQGATEKAASAPGPQQFLRPPLSLEPGHTEAAGAVSVEAQLKPIKPLVTADFFAEITRALRSYRHRRTKAREKMRRKRRAPVPGHTEEERR